MAKFEMKFPSKLDFHWDLKYKKEIKKYEKN